MRKYRLMLALVVLSWFAGKSQTTCTGAEVLDYKISRPYNNGSGKFLPAFSVAWYMKNLNSQEITDATIAGLQVASMFIGAGELALLLKVTAEANKALKVRRFILGFGAAAEAADLFAPNIAASSWEAAGYHPDEVLRDQAALQKVTTYLAVAGGVTQLVDLFVGIGKWNTIKRLIPENFENFNSVAFDIQRFMDAYPLYVDDVMSLFGLSTGVKGALAAVSNAKKLEIIAEIETLGLPLLKTDAQLVEILKNIYLSNDLTKVYKSIPQFDNFANPIRAKLFSDIKAGNMAADFIADPSLINGWKIFNYHGDNLSLDILSIKRLTDDLAVNPNLKTYLVNTENFFTWKSVQYLTLKTFDTDFLDWNKVFQNWTAGNGKNLYEHIFIGSIGGTNGISGVHHVDALTINTSIFNVGDIRITPGTKTFHGNTGFYDAEIEFWNGTNWIQKTENGVPIKNGFYPDSWTKKEIMEHIAYSRSKIIVNDWIPPVSPKVVSNTYSKQLLSGQNVYYFIGQASPVQPANVGSYTISVFPVF